MLITYIMILAPSISMLFMSTLYWHQIIMILIVLSWVSITTLSNSPLIMSSFISCSDLMSKMMIILSMWILALMFMASYSILYNNNMPKSFYITCIMLLMTLIMFFLSKNLFPLYVWFKASLIPTMGLIMLWGYQPERMQASMYLMMYTITASLPLLITLCTVMFKNSHMNMTMMQMNKMTVSTSTFFMLSMAFLVKIPLYSTHLWLPKAHVEAPVAGSMILAGILLKLGGYGLIRVVTSMPAMMNNPAKHYISSLALIGTAASSLMCLHQMDMKSLIAYSSIGHMGLMIAGIWSNSKMGINSSIIMMLAHGLGSSALFCMINIMYEMMKTRSAILTGGLLMKMPIMSLWWFMFICLNMAAPPTINLLSEMMLFMSIIAQSMTTIIPLMTISFLTAAYSLNLYLMLSHKTNMKMMNPWKQVSYPLISSMFMHLTPALILILSPDIIMSMN